MKKSKKQEAGYWFQSLNRIADESDGSGYGGNAMFSLLQIDILLREN